jgi:allophanate hydrolase subunit 2
MGMRLEGPRLKNIINANIKSEGLIRGTIQVPADGNPIILLSDHGTIGGYPKIAVVISADLDKISQMTPGTKIKFKEVNLKEAENLYKNHLYETKYYLEQIKHNE